MRSLSLEATPTCLQDPRVPSRVRDVLREVPHIVLLRSPVARAVWGWKHMSDLGLETLSFEEVVESEVERTAGELERMMDDPLYFSRAYHRYAYLDRGKYVEQLERWLAHFPRERLLTLESEDFYRDTPGAYQQVIEFLGLVPLGAP